MKPWWIARAWLMVGALVVGLLGLAVPAEAQNRGRRPARPAATPVPQEDEPVSVAESDSAADLVVLRDSGLSLQPGALVRFLEQGGDVRPVEGVDRVQLAVEAMARLAEVRHRGAVPVLSKIAAADFPAGLVSLVDTEMATVAPRSRPQVRQQAFRVLRLNAVTALGWLGDRRALDSVRMAMNAEPNTPARLQIALAMALLGDPAGMDFVVQVISRGNRREVAAAAAVFHSVVGKDYGITENTGVRQRRARAPQYGAHWKQIRDQFQPDREAILKRRRALATITRYTPKTTADYLKLAANYMDMNDVRGSRSAREYLAQAGASLNPELQRLALDPDEELDIRMEAMNWLFQNQRQRAHPILRQLRRDENPEIVDKADSLLSAPLDPFQTNYVFPRQ